MNDIERKVFSKTRKVDDVEIHVSSLTTSNGVAFVDIREFVLSLGEYGRGITIPADIMPDVVKGIRAAMVKPKKAPAKKAAVGK